MAAFNKRNRWEDHYAQQARKENYPARSVYKLQEIQQKYRLIRSGDHVLDLGCAPGSWLKFAAELTGPSGHVVGIDLTPIRISLPPTVRTYTADILHLDSGISEAVGFNFHVVLSDMAPATTGQKYVDSARSLELCETALQMALERLLPGGSFVCKIFQGEGFKTFLLPFSSHFQQHKIFKPQSCRKASKEIYLIGSRKK